MCTHIEKLALRARNVQYMGNNLNKNYILELSITK